MTGKNNLFFARAASESHPSKRKGVVGRVTITVKNENPGPDEPEFSSFHGWFDKRHALDSVSCALSIPNGPDEIKRVCLQWDGDPPLFRLFSLWKSVEEVLSRSAAKSLVKLHGAVDARSPAGLRPSEHAPRTQKFPDEPQSAIAFPGKSRDEIERLCICAIKAVGAFAQRPVKPLGPGHQTLCRQMRDSMPGILSDEPRVFRPVGLPIVARVPVSTKNPADKKRFSDTGITLASDKGALAFHCGVPASLLPLLSDDNGSHAEPVLDSIGRRAKKSGLVSDFIITSAFDELASVALVVFPADPKKPDECLRMIADIAESSFGGLIARVTSEDDDHDSQTAQTKAAALRVFESFEIQAEIQASCPDTAKTLPLRKSI